MCIYVTVEEADRHRACRRIVRDAGPCRVRQAWLGRHPYSCLYCAYVCEELHIRRLFTHSNGRYCSGSPACVHSHMPWTHPIFEGHLPSDASPSRHASVLLPCVPANFLRNEIVEAM